MSVGIQASGNGKAYSTMMPALNTTHHIAILFVN